MKIKVLVENISHKSDLRGEHGLSLLIECEKELILFDTGQSPLFYENANHLYEDLSDVSMVIISHGHYDHGGGLKKALDIINGPVYIQEDALGNLYACKDTCRYIGIEKAIKNSKAFIKVKGDYEINDKMILLNQIGKEYPLPDMNSHLYMEKHGHNQRDDFSHEQSLIIKENNKIILVTACSHLGILNIISACQKKVGRLPDIVFGGFHLSSDYSGFIDGHIDYITDKLNQMDIQYFTGHCTGSKGYEILKRILKDKIKHFYVGEVYEF